MEEKFRKQYRFRKNSIQFIANLVAKDMERKTHWNKALSPLTQVLIFLRYVASGSFLEVVSDTIGLDKSTVSWVVQSVAVALCKRDIFIR